AAYAFARVGQLKDLKQLIFEAPCRRDPLFQWGVCQLLGEIAVDPAWAVSARQQSVSLLGYLCQHDQDWGQDESVKAWMFTIITKLCASSEQAINETARSVLHDLTVDQSALTKHPYPLRARLPLPSTSSLLAKVQNIQYLEYDLHKFRLQRLEEAKLPVYILPMAKANLQARDDELFPLGEKVQDFLTSERQVMLIMGDSGAGKSTFNKHLESELLHTFTRGGPIPLFINLPAIDRPDKDLIGEHLRTNNFSEAQIQEMKKHRQFVLICDGYDESQLTVNLHTTNLFNRPGQWNVKMVISCRTQFLGQHYRSRFIPDGTSHYTRQVTDLFQEAVIAPFSKEQIRDYV
ncbi:WD_REPEATS_REGION domain-containing protein, partial [Mortierella sp. GBA39]